MSTSSTVSLGNLRQQAIERSDMENNPSTSTEAWNGFLTNSYKELYDMLISAYGNDYHVATQYQFQTGSSQLIPLPDGTTAYRDINGGIAPKFFKLLGVDMQYSASPTGWISLKRFEMIERNKYGFINSAVNWNGYTNLRYRVQGNNIYFVPLPISGQTMQLWYVPTPTNLQYRLEGATTIASGVVSSISDTVGLSVGMSISAPNIVPDSATITAVGSNSVTMSANAMSTNPITLLSMWRDDTQIEGISGWEEYVIVDAAIKSQVKQENDSSPLMIAKNELKARIEAMAEARDIGQAFHTSDVLAINGNGFDGFGDGGAW